MGSLGDNGGGWSPDGGMPELPPEWRDIVIPDDLSALADEVAAVRAELYSDRRPRAWQRLVDRPPIRRLRQAGAGSLHVPILIISLSVLVTIASLFASTWPGTARPATPNRANSANSGSHGILPAMQLQDVDGKPVALRDRLPAVILLIDGCDCATLVRDTAAAVRSDIAVVTVAAGPAPHTPAGTTSAGVASSPGVSPSDGSAPAVIAPGVIAPGGSAPGVMAPGDTHAGVVGTVDESEAFGAPPPVEVPPRPADTTVRRLWDPSGQARAMFDLSSADGTAAALLVDHEGRIVRTVPRTYLVEDLRPDLARLT